MSIPDSYLGPPSQPWGRWVTSTLRNYLAKRQQYDTDVYNAIKQLNVATFQPMRGILYNQAGVTITVSGAGTYYPINTAGTLDTDATFNMVAGTTNLSGLKNNTDQARTIVFIGSYDGKAGNNHAIGLKLALNGVPIQATETKSFAGSSNQFGQVITQWIIRVEPSDEVSMWVANIDTTDDLEIHRFKLLAHAIP
jgi:hypothetical protein